MPEGANAATELSLEHTAIETLASTIAGLEPGLERTRLVHEVADRFLVHTQVEERYLYPALRRFLPDGVTEAVGEVRQQRAAARIVESLETLDERADAYEPLVVQLVFDIQRHIEHQETVVLPALVDTCPLEEINELGRQLRGGLQEAGREGPAW
jgi:hypothetical protein